MSKYNKLVLLNIMLIYCISQYGEFLVCWCLVLSQILIFRYVSILKNLKQFQNPCPTYRYQLRIPVLSLFSELTHTAREHGDNRAPPPLTDLPHLRCHEISCSPSNSAPLGPRLEQERKR